MIKNQYLLFSLPFMIIGIAMILLGTRWMIVSEPWMLDQVANEDRLGMTFNELFKSEINKTLPDYLKQIYRFFGLWVIVIGLLVVSFSMPDLIKNVTIRIRLLISIGAMIATGTIMGYIWIPNSPFIYLSWGLILFYCTSLYVHFKIDK